MIIVKSTLDGDVRRFAYVLNDARNHSFQNFKETVARLYGLDRSIDFAIKYHDEEGDAISLTTDGELVEALTLANSSPESVLRITVILSGGNRANTTTQAASTPAAAPEPERTPPPLKYKTAPMPTFTQTPASQQMLDKAASLFANMLWERLFTQPELQEKFRTVIREAISTPAFADLMHTLAADMHPSAAAPPSSVSVSTSTASQETTTVSTSTEDEEVRQRDERDRAEIAEFQKLDTPPAEPAVAVHPTNPQTEEKKPEELATIPTPAPAPISTPPMDIPARRKADDQPARRSPSGVFGFISSIPSALSHLVSPHADSANCNPNTKRTKEDDNSTEYDELLARLVDMGFNDRDANLRALKRSRGNLERAVERLVRKAPKTTEPGN